MATNECSVVNPAVYGPYKQTIFLGCSVLGFTATAGWNGQNSEVTVELAQDTCSPPVDRPKRYWANPTTIFQASRFRPTAIPYKPSKRDIVIDVETCGNKQGDDGLGQSSKSARSGC